jgi:hypothetical protein
LQRNGRKRRWDVGWKERGGCVTVVSAINAKNVTKRQLTKARDKKNPDTVVPGLIHTNEEGGGDMVRTEFSAAKTSVEFNIAKRIVRRNIYFQISYQAFPDGYTVGFSPLSDGW